MAEGQTRKTGCFKLGCFGCAGVTLLTVLIFGMMIGIGAVLGRPDGRVEESAVEQPLPAGPTLESFSGGTDDGGPLLPPGGLVPEVDEPGRVILDLSMGEFEVVAGDGPGPIRIESELDTAIFELETGYERYGETGWIYRIRLKRKIGWYRMLFNVEDHNNFVRVILPRDVPLSLEGRVGMGETRMDLGGLWLVDTDLDASMGEFTIDFEEPLLAPMNDFRLVSKMGESRGGIGMGELLVWVPDDVNVDVENMTQVIGASNVADRSMLEELDEDAPTLRLDLSGGMGSIEVRRR
jgi:hypothetical protein